jgi:hypothetical protein
MVIIEESSGSLNSANICAAATSSIPDKDWDDFDGFFLLEDDVFHMVVLLLVPVLGFFREVLGKVEVVVALRLWWFVLEEEEGM